MGEGTSEVQLFARCTSDAFDLALAILYAEPDETSQTLN